MPAADGKLDRLSVPLLKERCKTEGLRVGGTKAELIARLKELAENAEDIIATNNEAGKALETPTRKKTTEVASPKKKALKALECPKGARNTQEVRGSSCNEGEAPSASKRAEKAPELEPTRRHRTKSKTSAGEEEEDEEEFEEDEKGDDLPDNGKALAIISNKKACPADEEVQAQTIRKKRKTLDLCDDEDLLSLREQLVLAQRKAAEAQKEAAESKKRLEDIEITAKERQAKCEEDKNKYLERIFEGELQRNASFQIMIQTLLPQFVAKKPSLPPAEPTITLTKPEPVVVEDDDTSTEWYQRMSESSGKKYYVNAKTGVTQWILPPGFPE